MNILLIGGGGREHAILKKIKSNPKVQKIYALPGNAGYGDDAVCLPISAEDPEGILDFAGKHKIDFAIVSPDDPLVMGLIDRLQEIGIPCFGPDKKAAQIEGSKAFSKNLMKKYGIPTADFAIFDDFDKAKEYAEKADYPIVIKASGLAKGKGVVIAGDYCQALDAIEDCMQRDRFGNSGHTLVIEEFLRGPEVSVLAFTDGKTIRPMVSSMDHKRAYDGDMGPNTGGMGCIAPNPYYSPEIAQECMEKIFIPTIRAMEKESCPFKGCLYFGLMLTEKGPKVIEYNCRFGDPEAQVVLPLLETDLLDIMMAVSQGRLADVDIKFSKKAACCTILASSGYPGSYKKGYEISFPKDLKDDIYFAGVKSDDQGKLLSDGGRVLGYTRLADNLEDAIKKSYEGLKDIRFQGAFCRKDIGKSALKALKGEDQ